MRKERKNELPMFSSSCRVRWLIRKRDGTHAQHTFPPRVYLSVRSPCPTHTRNERALSIDMFDSAVDRRSVQDALHYKTEEIPFLFFRHSRNYSLSFYFFNKQNLRGDMGKKWERGVFSGTNSPAVGH